MKLRRSGHQLRKNVVWQAVKSLGDFFRSCNEEQIHTAIGDRTPHEVYYGAAKTPKPTGGADPP